VVLQVEVDLQGLPRNVAVVSAPQPLFDEAALQAAQALRFEPARRGAEAIAVRIQYAVSFAAPPPPVKASELPVNLEGQLRERGTRKKLQGLEVQAGGSSAVTDAEGRFELRGLPEGQSVLIVIAAPGYRRYEREEVIAKGTKLTVEYRLQPLEASQFEATPSRATGSGTRSP
jgi:TonB family protein